MENVLHLYFQPLLNGDAVRDIESVTQLRLFKLGWLVLSESILSVVLGAQTAPEVLLSLGNHFN